MEFYISTGEMQRVIKLMGVAAKSNVQDSSGLILIEVNEDNSNLFLSNDGKHTISVIAKDVLIKKPGILAIEFSQLKSFINSFAVWNEEKGYGTKGFNFSAENTKEVYVTVDSVHENGKKSKGKIKLKGYDSLGIKKPKPFGKTTFILNSNIFKTAVDKVMYAINPAETRGQIMGMNIRFDEDNIYFAGTNGVVLSEYKIKNISGLADGNFILRLDFVMALKRALIDEYQMFFEFDNKSARIKFDDIYFTGSLIVGHTYPEYKQTFDAFSDSIVLDKNTLTDILSPMVDILDNDDYNRLSLSIKDKQLSIFNDSAVFEYEDDVNYVGELNLDVNGTIFNQSLSSIKDDKIMMKFSDENGYLILDSANFEDQKSLIVPIDRRNAWYSWQNS